MLGFDYIPIKHTTLYSELLHGTLIIMLSSNHTAHTAFHPPSPGIVARKDDINLRTLTVTQCHNPHDSHTIF